MTWLSSWAKLLNVKPEEAKLVGNFILHGFFQGIAIAFFFTSSYALFLKQFGTEQFPVIYIATSILLVWLGSIYKKAEARFQVRKTVVAAMVLLSASILMFRFGIEFLSSGWIFLYFLLAWNSVLYLICGLGFWSLASILFDVRQSKRLFSAISLGDTPAKFFGYLCSGLLAPLIGTSNLLWLSAAAFLLSIIFLSFIINDKANVELLSLKQDEKPRRGGMLPNFSDAARAFQSNKLIGTVATLAFVVVTSTTLLHFAFYTEVRSNVSNDADLAKFIGLFMAFGRVLTIVVKAIFTNRLRSSFGIKGALLITPLVVVAFVVNYLLFQWLGWGIGLYLLGAAYILSDLLKKSIQDPVFISLLQPLAVHARLKGHSLVKSIMNPAGMGFAGMLIIMVFQLLPQSDLYIFSFVILILMTFWIVGAIWSERRYVLELGNALNNRFIVGGETKAMDKKAHKILLSRISTSDARGARYSLAILESQSSAFIGLAVTLALRHESEEVKTDAIRIAAKHKVATAAPILTEMLKDISLQPIWPEAVKALCVLSPDEADGLMGLLESPQPKIMAATIAGLVRSGDIASVVSGGQKLLYLTDSKDPQMRLSAAEIIGEIGIQNYYKPLIGLLRDENQEVVKAAIYSCGKVGNEKLLEELMEMLVNKPNLRSKIAATLEMFGEKAVSPLCDFIIGKLCPKEAFGKLISTCGLIGGDVAGDRLVEMLHIMPQQRLAIFQALNIAKFKAKAEVRPIFKSLLRGQLAAMGKLMDARACLLPQKNHALLANAYQLELDELIQQIFLNLSILYDRERIMKAKRGIGMAKRDTIANALEVLELALPKVYSKPFIEALELRMAGKNRSAHEKTTVETTINDTLSDSYWCFQDWSKACALSVSKNSGKKIDPSLLLILKSSASKVIREQLDV